MSPRNQPSPWALSGEGIGFIQVCAFFLLFSIICVCAGASLILFWGTIFDLRDLWLHGVCSA